MLPSSFFKLGPSREVKMYKITDKSSLYMTDKGKKSPTESQKLGLKVGRGKVEILNRSNETECDLTYIYSILCPRRSLNRRVGMLSSQMQRLKKL